MLNVYFSPNPIAFLKPFAGHAVNDGLSQIVYFELCHLVSPVLPGSPRTGRRKGCLI